MKQKQSFWFALHLSFLFSYSSLPSQDLMLQGWYWDYPKTCNGGNFSSTLQNQAQDLKNAGFTYVWLPPLSRASFGNCSVGYDPKDLYDLGEYGGGPTGFGTRNQVNQLIQSFSAEGINSVADVIFNHRDGGKPEVNPALKDYITIHYNTSKAPYPSDRYRCILPIGGNTGRNAGNYYLKIKSKTQNSAFFNAGYKVYTSTNRSANYQGSITENENNGGAFNGGSDCGQSNTLLPLNTDVNATLDDGTSSGGCYVDEFKLSLSNNDFYAAGDSLYIYLNNAGGNYTDHYIYSIWYDGNSSDVVSALDYQTFTDFTQMPSGQGAMNFENFKPNSSNASSTYLSGFWDGMWFFNDYDQFQADTKTKLFDFSSWLWNDVGIRGYRMDAVKHFSPEFVGDLMDHLHSQNINPGMVVGEVYDANPQVLKDWLDGVYANMNPSTQQNISVRTFDFSLREALKNACDAFGYDVRNVFQSSLVDAKGVSPFQVVTFANNHDFRDAGQPIQNDLILAYAYLLTNHKIGIPCVFYPEYMGVNTSNAPLYNLKNEIDALWKIHQDYIAGQSQITYLNNVSSSYTSSFLGGYPNTSLIYQISGGANDVVVAINFSGETLKLNQEINSSSLQTGDTLFDALQTSAFPYALVDASNQMYVELPPRSYGVWIKGVHPVAVSAQDLSKTKYSIKPLGQNQFVLEGAFDASINGRILDLSGKTIQTIDQVRFSLEGKPAGTYVVEIEHAQNQQNILLTIF